MVVDSGAYGISLDSFVVMRHSPNGVQMLDGIRICRQIAPLHGSQQRCVKFGYGPAENIPSIILKQFNIAAAYNTDQGSIVGIPICIKGK